jgi:hypothetical protein
MRRPFDWTMVSLLLMVWFVARLSTDYDPVPRASVPAAMVSDAVAAVPESPFAYIREDGTEEPLPVTGDHGAGQPRAVSTEKPSKTTPTNASSNPAPALFTWSSPLT